MTERGILDIEPVPEEVLPENRRRDSKRDAETAHQRITLFGDSDRERKKRREYRKNERRKFYFELLAEAEQRREETPMPSITKWQDIFELIMEGRLQPGNIVYLPGIKPSRLKRMLNSKRLKKRLELIEEYANMDNAQNSLTSKWLALRKQSEMLGWSQWSEPKEILQVCRDVLNETRKVINDQNELNKEKIKQNNVKAKPEQKEAAKRKLQTQVCKDVETGPNEQYANIANQAFPDTKSA